MSKTVAVEGSLNNVKRYLASKGYNVVVFEDGPNNSKFSMGDYDAIVVTGQDSNYLGMEDIKTGVPVIDARGLTPEDIYNRLQEAND